MSNRHMATKRTHNKTRPADVQRHRRRLNKQDRDEGRRKAASRQTPPDSLTIQIPPGQTMSLSPALSQDFLERSAELVTSFESPESSNIHSARYDYFTEQMWIVFSKEVEGGECPTYLYTGIPATLWTDFVQAASKGRFVAQMIKPMFAGNRV